MRTFAKKPKPAQQTLSARSPKLSRSSFGQSRDVHSILHLQRKIGNHGVLRLLQTETENIKGFAHNFSQIPIQAIAPTHIQPKLKVNAQRDRYEQEADRIADQVLGQKMLEEDGSQKVDILARASQRAAEGESEGEVNEDLENQLNLSKGRGNFLSDQIRAFVEPHMQFDFSKVRVHTDDESFRMNRQLHARAFTHGMDIFFGAGQYAPGSRTGKRLLAHELTHVVQQGTEKPAPLYIQRSPGDLHEQIRRDDLLRRLARRPREAQTQWRSLSPGEQMILVQYMTLIYGDTFARRFLLYARQRRRHSIIDITNFPEYTDDRLRALGYRLADVQDNIAYWFHPSGNEAWIVRTGPGATTPTSAPEQRTRPLRTRDNVEIHGYRGRAELHPDGTILLFTQGRDNPITFREHSTPEHSMWSNYEIYDERGRRIDGIVSIRVSEIFGESAYEEDIDEAIDEALEL